MRGTQSIRDVHRPVDGSRNNLEVPEVSEDTSHHVTSGISVSMMAFISDQADDVQSR